MAPHFDPPVVTKNGPPSAHVLTAARLRGLTMTAAAHLPVRVLCDGRPAKVYSVAVGADGVLTLDVTSYPPWETPPCPTPTPPPAPPPAAKPSP